MVPHGSIAFYTRGAGVSVHRLCRETVAAFNRVLDGRGAAVARGPGVPLHRADGRSWEDGRRRALSAAGSGRRSGSGRVDRRVMLARRGRGSVKRTSGHANTRTEPPDGARNVKTASPWAAYSNEKKRGSGSVPMAAKGRKRTTGASTAAGTSKATQPWREVCGS